MQRLAQPLAIDVGGVPEIDAEIERAAPALRMELDFVVGSVKAAEAHSSRSRRPKPSHAAKHADALLPKSSLEERW